MTMQRRTFLGLSAAGMLGAGAASLFGTGQALADPAPANPYAVGVRRYNWSRGSRPCTTYVYYPAIGTAGGNPVTDAPAANGVFPVYNFTHGYGSSPQNSLFIIRRLAEAGFIVPAPHFNHNFSDVNNGNTSKDVSQIITNTLALNTSGPLAGRIRTDIGVGVSGHSLGGMTTHGLLTSWPDSRIVSANPQSCVDMGNPSSSVSAKVLFVHGDRDSTTQYSSARQAYNEITWPKAFLTFVGGSHTSFWSDQRFPTTVVDWARWTMYGDTAARDRLPSDAAGSNTRWEAQLGETPSGPGIYRLTAQHSGKVADIDAVSTAAGAKLIQWSSTGRTNQHFEFIDAGDGHVKIKARHSGLVLQVASNSNGADITQQSDTGAASQQWRIMEHGGGVVSLINRQSGLAMDVWEYSTSDGARITQYTYTGNDNQRFTRQAV
ncbi:RICIN domain-containing protein [Glycomyces sp. TRM65418]|uniref:RICIN domain-containing protein n=1 Tax=Glycomyces sp. TRM65418 TaxID=2867006 RepID=UPI001CE5F093|nr:RICIN domain-containing protein [Glycomyces sp. TRM65418]MCC3765971.1 RICIN domain-containing protein [Glycomyces sp. TRM65418]QZD55551.1 RICIN domain-containing protein [Glycomyces sp. TRM65418]